MIGRNLGRYRLVRELGSGGMGTVYEAVHKDLGRRVAIKVLHTDAAIGSDKLARFFNEARTASRIEHRSVVSVFEFDRTEEGAAYIIMEYLEGESLRTRLRKQPEVVAWKALGYAQQMAAALSVAHKKRVIHRDLKPDNIMLVPDTEAIGGERVKILDFGIAKLSEDELEGAASVKTRTGQIMGTPTYMSPEQCRGTDAVDDKVDVYALGVLLYEMLSGRPPFRSTGFGELMAMHMYADPPRLKDLVPEVEDAMVTLINAMLAKSSTQRPSMEQVATELAAMKSSGVTERSRPKAATSSDGIEQVPATLPTADPSGVYSDQIRKRINEVITEDPNRSNTSEVVPRRRGAVMIAAAALGGVLLLGLGLWLRSAGTSAKPGSPSAGEGTAPLVAAAMPGGNSGAAAKVASAAGADSGLGSARSAREDSAAALPHSADLDDTESSAQKALDQGKPKVALRLLRKISGGAKRKSTLALLCRAQTALGMSDKAAQSCREAGVESAPPTKLAAPSSPASIPSPPAAAAPVSAPAPERDAPSKRPEGGDAYRVDYLR